jgi:Signal transduction histidine kinase
VRLTLRSRLALTFTAVFLLAGAALVALTISLAKQSIDAANGANAPAARALQSTIRDVLAGSSTTPATKVPRGSSGSSTGGPSTSPSGTASAQDAAKAAALAGQKLLKANRAYTTSTSSAAVDRMITWAAVGAAVLLPVALLLGWLLAGRALRPVRAVSAAARRVSDSRLSERLNVAGPRDEITELATTFDAMLDRLEHAFDAQRRFVANASHELRTPLAVAGTAVDVVLAKPERSSTQLEAMARDVRVAVTRAEEVVDSLLALTRSQHLDRGRDEVDLAALAEDALDTYRPAIAERGLRVETQLRSARSVGDRPLLERLVMNLIDNAVRHNVTGGGLTVCTAVRDSRAELVVENSGAVIAPESVPALFEPFARLGGRARTGEAGLGLGLAIARAVADAHGAELVATALPSGGLRVELRLA